MNYIEQAALADAIAWTYCAFAFILAAGILIKIINDSKNK